MHGENTNENLKNESAIHSLLYVITTLFLKKRNLQFSKVKSTPEVTGLLSRCDLGCVCLQTPGGFH